MCLFEANCPAKKQNLRTSKDTKFPTEANCEYETLPSDSLCSKREFDASCKGKVLLGTPEIRKSVRGDLGWEGQTPESSTHDGYRTVVIQLICHPKDRIAGETQRHRGHRKEQRGTEGSRGEQKMATG